MATVGATTQGRRRAFSGGGRRIRRGSIRDGRIAAFFYLMPSGVIFALFTILPALFVLVISLFNWNMLNVSQSQFLGVGNYTALLSSSQFWHSLFISLLFTLGTVPTGLIFALAIALLLMRRFPIRGLTRLAAFSPYVTPVVATSIIWIWIFNPQFGLIDDLLRMLHLGQPGWFESTTWALPGVILYTLWHNMGFTVIIFMAGLSGISQEILEAARVDGASAWREFWHVTWHLLTPTTLFVLVISTIGSLQAFTQFFTMTSGGPIGATTTTSYLLYQMAFIFYHTGYAAAIAVVLFVIIGLLTLLQMGLAQRRTFYQ